MVGQHGICPNCERLIKVDPWVVQEIEKRKKPVAEKPAEEPKRGAQNTPVMDEVVSGQPSSGLAVSSMVLGILGVVGGWMCCGLLFAILAIILGHVAYCNEQRNPDQYAGKRMAIAGFTTGYVGLLMGIVASFALGVWGAVMTFLMNIVAEGMQQMECML